MAILISLPPLNPELAIPHKTSSDSNRKFSYSDFEKVHTSLSYQARDPTIRLQAMEFSLKWILIIEAPVVHAFYSRAKILFAWRTAHYGNKQKFSFHSRYTLTSSP